MKKNLKEFTESQLGIMLTILIPTITLYYTIIKDGIKIMSNSNPQTVIAIGVLMLFVLFIIGTVVIWLAIRRNNRRINTEVQQLKAALHDKAGVEPLLQNLTQVNDLWKADNALRLEIMGLRDQIMAIQEGNKLSFQQLIATTKAVVSQINASASAEDIQRIANILYDTHQHDDYEKIGIKKDIINLLKKQYHIEQAAKAESEISFVKK